ncbi:MAG: NDP-sugar synthase [Armatimonadetes bacterium]|nr:NDP-sugar synthase [Armatimonadota bacterium]
MVLAAGVGSRLDPLTRSVPKPMVPVVNKPVLAYILELLHKHGFREIVINLYYLGDQIEEYFGDGSGLGLKITYMKEEKLYGTAGSVKRAQEFFDDTFMVVGGDDLTDLDISRMLKYHKDKRSLATIALSLVDDPAQYGIALLNERGRINRFLEKPRGEAIFSNAANTGVYIFEPEVFDLIPAGQFYDFGRDLFPLLLSLRKPFYGWLTSSYWRDIGSLDEYRQAHYDSLQGRVAMKMPLPEVRRFVWMGENVEIDPTAEVGYPVVIGHNCHIEAGAKVLEDSILGDNCIVENNAVVSRSILWEGARVMRNTMIEGCVVGTGCQVKTNAAVFNGVIIDPARNVGG